MKGRYSGCIMTTYGHILPGAVRLASWAARTNNLSIKAKQRLKIIDWLKAHNDNISLAARHFGLNRETVRIWRQRFQQQGLLGLNDRSHRPKHLRKPTTPWNIVNEAVKLRKQYPVWSKYKLQVLLTGKGINISASTIGRILKRQGLINEKVSRRRSRAVLHPKARFPRGLKISNPGDFIQMDTKHIMLVGGKKLYQFTAIDVLSKRKIMKIYSSESSINGRDFLIHCLNTLPFSVKAVQTDNGSPFLKEFDKFCQERSLPHYFIYPRTPKQNSYVEISIGADKREFYQQGNVSSNLLRMQKKIEEWQRVWNEVRPHQSLNYLTPNDYLKKWQNGRLPTRDTITLQA